MISNNSSRFQSDQNNTGDEGSNMTFSHNKKGGITLESVESPRFNEEKNRLSTKSTQQNISKNTIGGMGQYSNESSLMNSQYMNQNSKDIKSMKVKEQGGRLSESIQRYTNTINQIQQRDSAIQSDSFSEQNSQQKTGIKPSIYIERERKSDREATYPMDISSSNYNSSSSNSSSAYSTYQKHKLNAQQYASHRLEDIEDIENYDSTNNEESGVIEQLRRLREKDYFEETENEQSFDRELNSRLRMIEVKKQLMNQSESSSKYNSAAINNNLHQNNSMDTSVTSSLASQTFHQLDFSNSKLNLPSSSNNNHHNNNNNKSKAGMIISHKNQNNLQNNSLYQELIEKKHPQSESVSGNTQLKQINAMQKQWENHVNQFTETNSGVQKQLNISGLSTQQDQLQQNHIQQQQHNMSMDEPSLHNQSNQSSMLRASRLDQSEQAIMQSNNQQSILGINSRFQNSTLYSRYSFLEQDQSRSNMANKSFDNSEKKNISRTIYNNSVNNPNLVARFVGGSAQLNSQAPYHNKSNSNINISSILPENLTDRRDNTLIGNNNNNNNNPNSKNSFLQEKNTINKSNFLDDQSIIHQKGQSLGGNNYQHNENNEISHISALDHLHNKSDDDEIEDNESCLIYANQQHLNNQQLQQQQDQNQEQGDEDDGDNVHQANYQEELTEYSQSAISNSDIKQISQHQQNPFIKKNHNYHHNNMRQFSHQDNELTHIQSGQILGIKQAGNKQSDQQIQNNQINNDKQAQKFVTLSQDFDEQSLYIEQKDQISNQQQLQQQQLQLLQQQQQQLQQQQKQQMQQGGQRLQRNLFQHDNVIEDHDQEVQGQSRERQFTSKFEGKTDNSAHDSFVSNGSNVQNQYSHLENQRTFQSLEQGRTGLTYSQNQQSMISISSPPPSSLPHHASNGYNFKDQQQFENEIERERYIDQIDEVITHKETRNFLKKHFAQRGIHVETDIYFVHFLDELSNEYGDLIEFSEDIDKIQFEEILQNKLTTNDSERISLNALQIFTKDTGLREKIVNIVSTIQSDSKQREKESINKKIFQEINSLSKILEQKSKDLARKEKALIERERNLKQKETDFKSILKGEYDVMLFSLDEAIKERNIEVNKRSVQLERNLKNKMKIIETKAKEMKQQSSNSSTNADKLKSKLASQEKQAEFLKIKTQDLEKKFVIEQEKNVTVQQKYDNLLKKHKELEKYIKEIQSNMQQVPSSRQQQSHSPDGNAPLSYSETGMESQFRQSEGMNNKRNLSQQVGQNHDMPSPIRIDSMDEDEFKMGEITISEINQALLHNGALNQWNIPADQKINSNNIGSISTTAVKKKSSITGNTSIAAPSTLKKKSPIGPMGANTTTDEEVKVLMSVVQTIMSNIKTTLPLIINMNGKGQNDSMQQLNESCMDMSIAATKNSQIDIGEFLYPCFNNLVGSLVEIIPSLLTKQCSPKHLYGIVDLMFRSISFKFKYTQHEKQSSNKPMQNSILSEEILESTRTIIKSHQDHINEIMMNPKKATELTFIPQTAFWKRKVKVLPKKVTSTTDRQTTTALSRLNNGQSPQIGFQLFSNEDVQKELLQVFKSYMDHSELLLKRKVPITTASEQGKGGSTSAGQNGNQGSVAMTFDFSDIAGNNDKNSTASKSLQFENQKYILLTRIDLQIMTLILQVNNKESINALQSIIIDISNESEQLNDFLRNYIINLGFVQILVWRMIQSKDETSLIELSVDIMLNMSSNGSHYKQFILDISEDNIISKLISVFDKYAYSHDICEKLSVILQRISYHNSNLKQRLTHKQIAIFRNKLAQAENSKEDSEFLLSNLRSILLNIS